MSLVMVTFQGLLCISKMCSPTPRAVQQSRDRAICEDCCALPPDDGLEVRPAPPLPRMRKPHAARMSSESPPGDMSVRWQGCI